MIITNIKMFVNSKGGEKMRIDRIKFITELAKQDITLVELAKKSGVNRVTLSNIKCGKSCRNEIAEKIATALDVKIEDLLEK